MLILVDISFSSWIESRKRKVVIDLLERLREEFPGSNSALNIMAFNRGVQRLSVEKLSRTPAQGATDLTGALSTVLELQAPVTVLITDGLLVHPDTEESVRDMVEAIHDQGMVIHCLSALDGEFNEGLLKHIADRTGGNYVILHKRVDMGARMMLDLFLAPVGRLNHGNDPNEH